MRNTKPDPREALRFTKKEINEQPYLGQEGLKDFLRGFVGDDQYWDYLQHICNNGTRDLWMDKHQITKHMNDWFSTLAKDREQRGPRMFMQNYGYACKDLAEILADYYREEVDRPTGEASALPVAAARKAGSLGETFPSPPDLQWGEVTLTLVSKTSIEIKARGIRRIYTYAQMGFANNTSADKPNKIWSDTLVLFAKSQGELSWEDELNPKEQQQLQKNISRLRKELKRFFVIGDDPFKPYRTTLSSRQMAARDLERTEPRYQAKEKRFVRVAVAPTKRRRPGAYKAKFSIIYSADNRESSNHLDALDDADTLDDAEQ